MSTEETKNDNPGLLTIRVNQLRNEAWRDLVAREEDIRQVAESSMAEWTGSQESTGPVADRFNLVRKVFGAVLVEIMTLKGQIATDKEIHPLWEMQTDGSVRRSHIEMANKDSLLPGGIMPSDSGQPNGTA